MENTLEMRSFRSGEEVFREGDLGFEIYIVKSGLVEISRQIEGEGRATLAFLGEGNLFGEMALVDRSPRSARAVALEDTVCFVLPESVFRENMARSTPLVQDLVRMLVKRLRLTTQQVPFS